MMRLYEITKDLLEIQECDEWGPEQEEQLKALGENFNQKVDSIVHLLANLKSEKEMLEREIERLQEREATVNLKIQNVKNYLMFNMESLGMKRLRSGSFTISLANNSQEAISLNDGFTLTDVPKEFIRTTEDLDKRAILDNLKLIGDAENLQIIFPWLHRERGKHLLVK